ncbi:MAG: autotransporter domain-containing protein [Neisseriaceae bacterium]
MKIKRSLSKLAISLSLIAAPNLYAQSAYAQTGLDIKNLLLVRHDLLGALSFAERRINEWSIGVFNPDYVPNFPKEDYTTKLPNYEFTQVVSFGDSLSDKGTNTRSTLFLAGGYHSKLYNDYLSEYYSGKASIPHTFGGVNYAQAGSTIKLRKTEEMHIHHQIEQYLAKFGHASPDSIYILNAGAMDINDAVVPIIWKWLKGTYHFDSQFYTVDDTPKVTADEIRYLQDKGARYIMIANIPDAAFSPNTPLIPVEMFSLLLGKLYIPDFGLVTHVGKIIDNQLRDFSKRIPANTTEELIRLNGIHTMQTTLWFLPHPAVTQLYNLLVNVQRHATRQFNNSLELELSKLKGDIVFIDARKFMLELLTNYRSYGIDDVLVPTCDLGFSARYCDYESEHYHKDKIYAMSDWFHPSPAAHLLLAQYIQSIFDAPVYVNALGEAFSNVERAKNYFLDAEFFNIGQEPTHILKKWHFIGAYSGLLDERNYRLYHLKSKKTRVHSLNLGAYTFVSPKLAMGFLLNAGMGKQRPFDHFGFRSVFNGFTVFGHWDSRVGYWVDASFGISHMQFRDIVRSLQLGPLLRTEHTRATKAYALTTRLKAGYNWIDQPSIQSGPRVGLNLSQIRVQKFKEEGSSSSAMHFFSYNKHDFYASAGWFLVNRKVPLRSTEADFKTELTYNHSLGRQKTVIRGALNSTASSFSREVKSPQYWLAVNFSANFKPSKTTAVLTNLSLATDAHKNCQISYGLSYNHQF